MIPVLNLGRKVRRRFYDVNSCITWLWRLSLQCMAMSIGSYLGVFSYEVFADFVGWVGRSRADCCLVPGLCSLGWCPARCRHHARDAWIGVVQWLKLIMVSMQSTSSGSRCSWIRLLSSLNILLSYLINSNPSVVRTYVLGLRTSSITFLTCSRIHPTVVVSSHLNLHNVVPDGLATVHWKCLLRWSSSSVAFPLSVWVVVVVGSAPRLRFHIVALVLIAEWLCVYLSWFEPPEACVTFFHNSHVIYCATRFLSRYVTGVCIGLCRQLNQLIMETLFVTT